MIDQNFFKKNHLLGLANPDDVTGMVLFLLSDRGCWITGSNIAVEIPSELALKLGPVLLDKRPELFAKHVENNLISCHKVLTGLQKSAEPDRERIQQVEAEIAELEGLL